MAIVRNVITRIGADINPLRKGMKSAHKVMGNFSGQQKRALMAMNANMKKLMSGMNTSSSKFKSSMAVMSKAVVAFSVAATAAFAAVSKKSISMAMDVIESENLFEVSMGSMTESAREWSNELQKTLGLNGYEVRKNVGLFYNMTTSMGLTKDQAYELSTGLTELAYDMSSFFNMSSEQMFEKLRSGITGEIKPLKQLGIIVNETTTKLYAYASGIAKSGDELTEQQKVMARYVAILDQTKNAQGDLARTIKTPANQFRILNMQLQLSCINLGNVFMPIVERVLPVLTDFASRLAKATEKLIQFSQALFGSNKEQEESVDTALSAADAQTELGEAIKDAGNAAKKGVMGFDEVNQLQNNMTDDAEEAVTSLGGISKSETTTTPIEEIDTGIISKIQEIGEKIKMAFEPVAAMIEILRPAVVWLWNDFLLPVAAWTGGTFVTVMDGVVEALKNLGDWMRENKEIVISGLAGILSGVLAYEAITGIPVLITGVKTALKGLSVLLSGALSPAFLIAAAIAALVAAFVYFYTTNESFRNTVQNILNSIKDAAIFLWKNALVPLGNFLGGVFKSAWEGITVAAGWFYKNILVPVGDFFVWFWKSVLKPIGKVLLDVLGTVFKIVTPIIKSLWKNVIVPLGEFFIDIFNPTIEALGAIFQYLWLKIIKPFGEFLINKFKNMWEAIVIVLEFLWYKVLKPVAEYVGGVFADTFNKVTEGIKGAIEGLKTAFKGLMSFITGVFTGDWDKAWNGIKKIFSGVFDALYSIVKVPMNLIIDAINAVIRGLNKISVKVPDWGILGDLAGKSFGINIPTIPKLAAGGIITGPTLAMLGENNKNEMVVPLENTSFVDKLASSLGTAVMSAIQFSKPQSNQSNGDIIIQVDGVQLARVLIPAINKEQSRIGNYAIVQGV